MTMIQVILGEKGTGKTKRLIDMTNASAKTEQGQVVFIDDDKRYIYDLPHQIRFVDASEYVLGKHRSTDWFFGMLGGMLATNFDISMIFVDAFLKLVNNKDYAQLESLFSQLESLGEAHKVTFVLSVSASPEKLPSFITRYAI